VTVIFFLKKRYDKTINGDYRSVFPIASSWSAANLKPNIEARQQAVCDFAGKLKEIIEDMKASGLSQRAICAELKRSGIKTAKGGEWSLIQLQRVMARFTD
jgi:hypothetical protein